LRAVAPVLRAHMGSYITLYYVTVPNVGMGLDEHPRPTGRIRNLHENFVRILNATGGKA